MNIRYATIRRVTITGRTFSEGHKKALEWAFKNGYKVIRSGLKRKTSLRFEPTRFEIVAEKVVESRNA